ncbi:membrane alanyl aminopeptidase-like [Pieris brassicae]|uniref:membrane alanyl aminopeptidase-like n=1 Tax=Pieris brassicae TaxID=7116 RepID=UPI001E662442|nr:membrane alanyl aminopeptidase-like [Pieris brassicae]
MATLFLVLSLVLVASAIPPPPSSRNTIFIDEQLEGQIFEVTSEEITDLATINTSQYRLPTTTRPTHYEVLWIVDIDQLTYSGTVEITLVATQANVQEIVLHSKDLDISSVTLLQGETVLVQNLTSIEFVKELELLKVRTGAALEYNATNPVIYTLKLSFEAELRKDMAGIYRSWYRNSYNESVRWMATTQFQPTSGRTAFPCYDEPSFKATFSIRIRRPSTGFKSWSCTHQQTTNVNVTMGFDEDVYTTTPTMSTYLIALIVAEYDTKKTPEVGPLKYEVIARPGAMGKNQSDYAFDVGQKLLEAMSQHTALDFFSQSPNLKMTQASIPDFSAGAMENWGLLTYSLYQVESEMGFDTRFVIEQVHTSMLADSADNHPLSNPNVGSPDDISNMFSTISYNKGAAIIRMTEHLLGTDVHTQGLRVYLRENSYKTVVPSDLSQTLHNAAVQAGAISEYGRHFSVVDYYKTWHDQPGVPVIYVDVNHKTGDMTITQRRFDINAGYASVNYNWQIPISFATASDANFNDTKPSHVLTSTVTVVNRGTVGDEWVIFNKQQTGYYRVNYDQYTWNLIIVALRGDDRTKINENNRAQIVDDVLQFARSGLMTYTRAFNILSFLQYEKDYAPWLAAMTGFSWIRNRLVGSPLLAKLERQIVQWATPLMNELGYTPVSGESFMRSYLRRQLAPVMCNMGVEACRTSATTQFRRLIDDEVEVSVNSRNWVYCNGLRASNNYSDYATMWKRFIEHNVYTEKIVLLQTLGCTPLERALNELLTSLVQDNYEIREQDYTTTFNTALTGNEGNTQIVLNFIKRNLIDIEKAFGSLSSPLRSVAARLRSTEQITEFQLWLNQTQADLGNAYTSIYRAAESARNSLTFAEQIQGDLDNYLTNGDDDIGPSTPPPDPIIDPSTFPRPDVTPPPTPDLPGSAMSAAVSIIVVAFAAITNIIL